MLPNEDQCAIAEMARQFARERLKPFAEQWSREHRYPAEAIGDMAALGFFGMLVPEQWGGSDTGYLAYAMALEEIAAGDGACSTIMSVHNSVGCVPILRFGNDQQKRDFCPLARGEQIGAFALTEPQAGSDASSLRTRARRDGDHYVLNGAKQFITSGKHAGTVIVSPSPIRTPASAVSVPLSCRPTARVIRWCGSRTSSASTPRTPARLPSRICACRWPTGWARARATASPWPTWRAAVSASPPRRWAWPAPPSKRRATTPGA